MNNPPPEILGIYNIQGQSLNRTAPRGTVLKTGEYYLAAHVWIKNSSQEYLIQKRTESKDAWPGIWATTAGTIPAGEEPLSGAVRELEEELGITALPNELRFITQSLQNSYVTYIWLLERDVKAHDITMQEEEVSAVMWAKEAVIRSMIADGTFLDYGSEYLEQIFQI